MYTYALMYLIKMNKFML